ncbi:MAG: hypothetical protein QXV17_11640 [Candidatus Micrarchaeaceae archaeon]
MDGDGIVKLCGACVGKMYILIWCDVMVFDLIGIQCLPCYQYPYFYRAICGKIGAMVFVAWYFEIIYIAFYRGFLGF